VPAAARTIAPILSFGSRRRHTALFIDAGVFAVTRKQQCIMHTGRCSLKFTLHAFCRSKEDDLRMTVSHSVLRRHACACASMNMRPRWQRRRHQSSANCVTTFSRTTITDMRPMAPRLAHDV